MIDDLFDEETWKEIWLEDHDKEIMAKGEKKGRKEGREEGRKEGEKKGREEGRKEGEKKGREEGEKKGKIDMLISLVRKGILDITQAASESNMSLEDFKKMVES